MNEEVKKSKTLVEFREAANLEKFDIFLQELQQKEKFLAKLLRTFFAKAKQNMNESGLAALIQKNFQQKRDFDNFMQFWKFINEHLENFVQLHQRTLSKPTAS